MSVPVPREMGDQRVPFERGTEWVSFSVSPIDSRTLTARCEMDDSQVERHVEGVMVPAGNFTCHHYRYVFDEGYPDRHPDEHVWCTDDDLILVKIRWDHLRTTYVLTELKGDARIGRRTPS